MEPEMYADYRKEKRLKAVGQRVTLEGLKKTNPFAYRAITGMKPGMIWDAEARTWAPVDYIGMSVEQLRARREASDDRLEEVRLQAKALAPEAAAQALLNKGAEELQELLVDAIKKAPEVIIGLII